MYDTRQYYDDYCISLYPLLNSLTIQKPWVTCKYQAGFYSVCYATDVADYMVLYLLYHQGNMLTTPYDRIRYDTRV